MGVQAAVADAAASLHAFVSTVNVDDSRVPYFELTLGFIVASYAWNTYLDLRQRQAVRTRGPPEALKGHYTDEHVAKTRAYSLDKKSYGLVKGAFDFAENVAVLWFALLPVAWGWSRMAVAAVRPAWGESEYAVSIAFALLTTAFETVQGVPWGLYHAFVIEHRHGFNKQTVGLFFADIAKQLALTAVLLPPILAAIIYILRVASPYMPLYLWAFFIALQLAVLTVYPTLIAPLFNTYKPLPDGALRRGIEALARSVDFPLRKLFEVDGSKRSGHSNAYMYGFGRNKRIVLYDTLMQHCARDEQVVAVVAHELGHWKLGHTVCLMATQSTIMLAQFVLFAVFRSSGHLLRSFGFEAERPVIVALMLFMMVIGPLDSLIGWCFNLLSRRFEYQADGFAVKLRHAEPLEEALKVLDKENKSDFVVDWLYSQYHYSHPTLAERLAAIHKAASKVL